MTAQQLFEACVRAGVVQDLRTWDGKDWHDAPGMPGWKAMTMAVDKAEKAKWERAARLLNAQLAKSAA